MARFAQIALVRFDLHELHSCILGAHHILVLYITLILIDQGTHLDSYITATESQLSDLKQGKVGLIGHR